MATWVLLRFEELLDLWQTEFRSVPLDELLGLTTGGDADEADHYSYPASTLRRRFRDTWWHVCWRGDASDKAVRRIVQCKYAGDARGFIDARPHNPAA